MAAFFYCLCIGILVARPLHISIDAFSKHAESRKRP